jgi:hypothetical protein
MTRFLFSGIPSKERDALFFNHEREEERDKQINHTILNYVLGVFGKVRKRADICATTPFQNASALSERRFVESSRT